MRRIEQRCYYIYIKSSRDILIHIPNVHREREDEREERGRERQNKHLLGKHT